MEVLQHKVINVPNVIIGSTGGLQKKGNSLIILDYKSDSLFHLIDIKNKIYLGQFGRKGQGPNEFDHPNNIQIYDNDQICCYDGNKAEVKKIEIDSMNRKILCSAIVKFRDNWNFDVIPISSQTFLAHGCYEDAMFRIINEKDETLSVFASYPYKDESEKNISNRLRAMAYQGTMRMNGRGYMAFAVTHAKLIYLYMVDGDKLIKLGEIIDSYAKYTPDTSVSGAYSVAFDGKYPECYMDLAITDDFVYALYSGRSFKEFETSCRESEYIYVYNWIGKLVKSYKLDIPVSRFCLDQQSKKIYAIANLPDPTIVVFDYGKE
ncbi:BF3164 family lipoprotein [Phocaeicola sp.]